MEEHPLAMACTSAILAGVMLGIGFEGELVGPIVLLLIIAYMSGAVMNMIHCERDGMQPLMSLLALVVLSSVSVVFGYMTIRYFVTSDILKMFMP
ncbi:MAG: hypothetical protein JXJ17_17955 [Anaerolineae bacterium]|nr:hypothetical protein [Anaerolineae bacterium]